MSDGLSSSYKILADREDYYAKVPTRPEPPKPSPAAKPPVTEDTLQSLLNELRRNIATDIGQLRKEINGVSALLQLTELNSADHENCIQVLERPITALQHRERSRYRIEQILHSHTAWLVIQVSLRPILSCVVPDLGEEKKDERFGFWWPGEERLEIECWLIPRIPGGYLDAILLTRNDRIPEEERRITQSDYEVL
ncbi:Hypothetical predicted protein [Pelobates cultripes]|uniref:Uncharacterized protein n=1 Tax=Pelobates cultripes TaxID=61616 RepID=A0AAD1RK07_PELCU|nr:Hypothetical predicted protein [Pelobates cultripes]